MYNKYEKYFEWDYYTGSLAARPSLSVLVCLCNAITLVTVGHDIQSAKVTLAVHTKETAAYAHWSSVRGALSRPIRQYVRQRRLGQDFTGKIQCEDTT